MQLLQFGKREEHSTHRPVAGSWNYCGDVLHWQTPTPPTKTKVGLQVSQEVLLVQVRQVEGQGSQVATGNGPAE